jgi:hypothetical protein
MHTATHAGQDDVCRANWLGSCSKFKSVLNLTLTREIAFRIGICCPGLIVIWVSSECLGYGRHNHRRSNWLTNH